MLDLDTATALVQNVLTDDLLKPEWRNRPRVTATAGHCYAASEAIYHLCGGKEAGLTPMRIRHNDGPHWFLRTPTGYVDPTEAQFENPVPHEEGTGCGFLTREPSRRAAEIIRRVKQLLDRQEPAPSRRDLSNVA